MLALSRRQALTAAALSTLPLAAGALHNNASVVALYDGRYVGKDRVQALWPRAMAYINIAPNVQDIGTLWFKNLARWNQLGAISFVGLTTYADYLVLDGSVREAARGKSPRGKTLSERWAYSRQQLFRWEMPAKPA